MTGRSGRFRALLGFVLALGLALPTAAGAQEGRPFSLGAKDGDQAIEITADRLQFLRDEDRYIADGNVLIVQGSARLTADHLTMDNKTGQVTADGRAVLRDGDDVLTAERLDFNLRTRSGTAVPGGLFIKKDNYRLESARMEKSSDNRYELQAWSLTACDTEEGRSPLWRFRGSRARADLGEYLVARDVVFYIKDVPVLYTPYMILPIKTERQSGFLIPRFGYSTRDGLRFNEAFFWAIGPSQDATVSLDYRSVRGTGAGLEYRYKLSRGSEGTLNLNLFDDRTTGSRRTETDFRHVQRFNLNLQARLDVHLVSDINQFRELSDTTADRVQQSLISTFVIFRRWENQEAYLLARLTKDLTRSENTTLQQLPEAGYRLREYRLGRLPLWASLDATAVNFWREREDPAAGLIRAVRVDVFPRLASRINLGGVTLTPRAGYHETWYSRTLEGDSPRYRGIEVLDMAAHTRLTRVFGEGGSRRLIHQLEPAVVYDYVPRRDQSDLPQFDDLDRLPRTNRLTYSLTNRLVVDRRDAEGKGLRREAVFFKLTQSYDLHARRTGADPGSSRPMSNLRSETVLRPWDQTSVGADVYYDLYRRETVSFNTDVRFRPLRAWNFSLGQRYSREGTVTPRGDVFNSASPENDPFWFSRPSPLIRYLTGDSQLFLPGGFTLSGRAYYDLDARAFGEIHYGLWYVGDCLGFQLTYQDLPDRNQTSFMITLRPSEMSPSKSLFHF